MNRMYYFLFLLVSLISYKFANQSVYGSTLAIPFVITYLLVNGLIVAKRAKFVNRTNVFYRYWAGGIAISALFTLLSIAMNTFSPNNHFISFLVFPILIGAAMTAGTQLGLLFIGVKLDVQMK